MQEQNKALVRRVFEECWNRGDLTRLDEIMTRDYAEHDPNQENFGADFGRGSDYYRNLNRFYRTVFPDLHFEIEDLIAEEDRVVARWTSTGTHRGDLMEIPPSGKRVRVRGISVHRIANGKLVETWVNWDAFGMLKQLGVVGEPARSRT
jgi:steroid delta-isomerase-like uncharacterized protein